MKTPPSSSAFSCTADDDQHHYVVITPVRNEEKYIEATIASMAYQEIRPCEWIIVNDGSSDNTGPIIDEAAGRLSWIKPIHRGDRGFRHAGTGVMESFREGYEALTCHAWNYIVKMDGDLKFDSRYFRQCFAHFDENPRLGIGGGMICHEENGVTRVDDKNPLFHVRGATKIYRKKCWQDIAPLLCSPGWDTVDEVKANMLGWETKSFTDLQLLHLRHTGAADGTWRHLIKSGTVRYVSGYHPLFVLAKAVRMLPQKPYLLASLAFLYGYIGCFFRNVQRVTDPAFISYARSQQLKRLTGQESIWK